MHIKDEKDLLRARIKERLMKLSEKDRQAESRSISRRILENLPETATTICAYMAMPSEADLHLLLERLLDRKTTVFVPRFTRTNFEFRQLTAFDDLIPGKFGLPEPLPSANLLDIKKVDCVLVPGIAFDRSGHRLGRGNGGYDRWLEELRKKKPDALIWGVALDCQMTDAVPVELHDALMDAVVTPREMIIVQ